MTATPTFKTPPVVELVLGAQFSPLTKLTAGHFGLFWKELGSDWVTPSDGPLLDDQFELFDRPIRSTPLNFPIQLKPMRFPNRFLLEHRSKDRLIQLQSSRFLLNWRRRDDFYPSYKNLIAEFETTFGQFASFVQHHHLGVLALNQWELTYIDSFPQNKYWETPADWSNILPGLFGSLFPTDEMGIEMEHRGAEWSYEITPKRGRLHIMAHPGSWRDDSQESLLLMMTTRGPIGKDGAEGLRAGLDLGHAISVDTFLRVVDKTIRNRWGEQ